MTEMSAQPPLDAASDAAPGDTLELLVALAPRWRLLLAAPVVAGLVALGACFVLTPQYTARTAFLPPQQQQQGAAGLATAAMSSSLGSLSSLLGGSALRTPIDQYVSLLQSTTVADRLIERFDLQKVYDKDYRYEARKKLARRTDITAGKKDGVIVVEVEDESPQRAADMANRYVEELRLMTNRLALTEAQQRRQFFEGHLQRTRDKLTEAQQALQGSGLSLETIKAEPKAAAEGYAKLKSELTNAQARRDALRRTLTDRAPELQQVEAAISVLQQQLARMEGDSAKGAPADYVAKYREFKYYEMLFEQFSRQYELARLDESREGQLQVIDAAQPPERKSWPRRWMFAVGGALGGLIAALAWVLTSHQLGQPEGARQWARLRAAFKRP